jgi:hypothetical protein
VKNIITYIQNEKKAISKSFALYDKEKGGPGGSVLLKLVRTRESSGRRDGTLSAPYTRKTVDPACAAAHARFRVSAAQNFIPKGASAPLGVVAPPRASTGAAGAAPAAAEAAAAPAPEINLGEHNVVITAEEEAHAPTHVHVVKAHGGGPPIALIAGALLAVVAAVAAAALSGGASAAPAAAPAAKGKAKGKAAAAAPKKAPASPKKAPASPKKAPASPKKGGKK